MTTNVSAGYASNLSRTHGDMETVMETIISLLKESIGGAAPLAVALAGDAFTPPNNSGTFVLSSESGSADNLANVSPVNTPDGRIILVMAASGHTITLKHNAGGTGKLRLAQSADKAISGDMCVRLRYESSTTTYVEDDRNMQAMFPPTTVGSEYYVWGTPNNGAVGQWAAITLQKAHLNVNNIMNKIMAWLAPTPAKQPASNILTPAVADSATIEVKASSGTTDSIKWIDYTNCPAGTVLRFRAFPAHTITFQHAIGGNTGNQGQIKLTSNGNVSITGNQILDLQLWNLNGVTEWVQVNDAGLTGGGGGGVSTIPGTVQGRLSIVSGQPEMQTNKGASLGQFGPSAQTSATLYWVPMRGGTVTTYDGSQWVTRQNVVQQSVSVAAKTLGAKCAVWMRHSDNGIELEDFISRTASNSPSAGSNVTINIANTTGFAVGDVVTIVSGTTLNRAVINAVNTNVSIVVDRLKNSFTTPTVWSNAMTSVITYIQGVPLKTGDTTRMFLGVIEISKTAGLINMEADTLGLSNYWNRRWWHMEALTRAGTSNALAAVSAWRIHDNDDTVGKSRIDIVACVPEITVTASIQDVWQSGGAANTVALVGVGINDQIEPRSGAVTFAFTNAANVPAPATAQASRVLVQGTNCIWRLEKNYLTGGASGNFGQAKYEYPGLTAMVEY